MIVAADSAAARRRAGLTLLEMLLALSLGAILIALLFSAQRLLTQAARGRARRAAAGEPALRMLRQAARELTGVGETERAETTFRIVRERDRSLLEFVTAATAGEAERPDDAQLRRLRYLYAPDPVSGAGVLWRLEQSLAGVAAAAPETTNRILESVTAWRADAWDGAQWRERWPEDAATNRLPLAVRLRIEQGAPAPLAEDVELWIPAAATFTSSVQRAAAPVTPPAGRGGR